MLLVLAVLALAVSFAGPSIASLQRRQRVDQGAEFVRAKMGNARVHAVECGVPYQFRFEPGGRRFIVVPFDHDALAAAAQYNSNVRVYKAAGMLAEGAMFEGGQSQFDSGTKIPDDWLASLPEASLYAGAQWSGPILFFPDGSAAPADFSVMDRDRQHQVVLNVRALTGAVTIARPN
jgi:hypothetical protein